ncbi:hypothetical protein [Zhongshania borealis]
MTPNQFQYFKRLAQAMLALHSLIDTILQLSDSKSRANELYFSSSDELL